MAKGCGKEVVVLVGQKEQRIRGAAEMDTRGSGGQLESSIAPKIVVVPVVWVRRIHIGTPC